VKRICTSAGTLLLAAVLTALADPAAAQSRPPVIRGDVAGNIGWLTTNLHPSTVYDSRDWAANLFGSVSAGWHWTDNLKTELDLGATTKTSVYRVEALTINGRPAYETTRSTFSKRTFGLSQQYQFFHNVWFHPHVAAGATVTWERALVSGSPIFIADGRAAESVVPGTTDGPRTTATVRPFVGAGFKGYMTDRVFFRSDTRVTFRRGVDEVWVRMGVGVDF
jgi:outer membrane protein W